MIDPIVMSFVGHSQQPLNLCRGGRLGQKRVFTKQGLTHRSSLFIAIVAAQAAALMVALAATDGWIMRSAVFIAIAVVPTTTAAWRVREHGW